MRANEHLQDGNAEKSRGYARRAPLCYSRESSRDGDEQARLDSTAALVACSVMSCATAAFLVVHGGWGL